MKTKRITVLALLCTMALASVAQAAEKSPVEIGHDDEAGQMRVLIDGQEAFVYQHSKDVDLPHFFPLRSPGGKSMTVQHPNPYPHHRSVWFGDKVKLEGERPVSFYNALYSSADKKNPAAPFKDHVRHLEFSKTTLTGKQAALSERLVWEMDHIKPVLDELREITVVALGGGEYLLDINFKLTAAHGEVKFVSDSVHYAWPYVRMNTAFSVDGGGKIVNSEGEVNQKGTNNRVTQWIDYSNTVEGETAGLAIFSHADNPRPHRWLTRDYGTFGPRRTDEKSGKPFALNKGESLSMRVGILVHRGDVTGGKVKQRYDQYNTGKL